MAALLGVSPEVVAAAVAERQKIAVPGTRAEGSNISKALSTVRARVAERVGNACILAAPTGCASFQLRFGASILHRVFWNTCWLRWPVEET